MADPWGVGVATEGVRGRVFRAGWRPLQVLGGPWRPPPLPPSPRHSRGTAIGKGCNEYSDDQRHPNVWGTFGDGERALPGGGMRALVAAPLSWPFYVHLCGTGSAAPGGGQALTCVGCPDVACLGPAEILGHAATPTLPHDAYTHASCWAWRTAAMQKQIDHFEPRWVHK